MFPKLGKILFYSFLVYLVAGFSGYPWGDLKIIFASFLTGSVLGFLFNLSDTFVGPMIKKTAEKTAKKVVDKDKNSHLDQNY